MEYNRRMPVGAEVQKGGGTHFRVWSITASNVRLRVSGDSEVNNSPVQAVLNPEGNHYFSGYVPEAKAGDFYKSSPEVARQLPNPAAKSTFEKSKLDFDDLQAHQPVYLLHKDLIALRRSDPVINGRERHFLEGAIYGLHLLILRYFGLESGDDRLMMINFGRDQVMSPAPIPLLAPPLGRSWKAIFSSEDPGYAGQGAPTIHFNDQLAIVGHSATVFKS